MRIAIPVTNDQIANHLGMAQKFYIADVEDGQVVRDAELPNPGHGPGGPPPIFLMKLGVNQVLAWGLPAHACDMFASGGVNVQLGATGEPKQVIQDFINGRLKLTTEGLDGGGSCSHDH